MTEQEFDKLRPSAFAIAYRMLGTVNEAEDVVQEGFLRLHRARDGGERIESPVSAGFTTRREEVNGQAGALVFDREGSLISVTTLDIAEGEVQGVNAIVNPHKLRHLRRR